MTDELRTPASRQETVLRYRVIGMDCADDAREIEGAVRDVSGVASAYVSTASQVLTIHPNANDLVSSHIEAAVASLGYQLDRVSDDRPTPSHLYPRYRRALRIVVGLNIGFGILELVGGIISESQALKADALDFLADGMITLFGVVAIGWSIVWRARSALAQGLFLGVLGLGVLANTAYRVFVQQQPEADVMGVIAVAALMVNVTAAMVLIPHRTGDANARAVWLFSRNDAIGNAAVILAALLVAWTKTAWPDLIVAAIVASLFLHSAWSIIGDARSIFANRPIRGLERDIQHPFSHPWTARSRTGGLTAVEPRRCARRSHSSV
jgi:Co/Zn/Cd efflux system component